MESIKQFWSETMEIQEARWIVAIAGLVICVAAGFYVVRLFRDMALGKTDEPSSYISEFQKLRDEGKLDDEEYSKLAKAIPKVVPNNVGKNGTDEVPDFKEQPEPTD